METIITENDLKKAIKCVVHKLKISCTRKVMVEKINNFKTDLRQQVWNEIKTKIPLSMVKVVTFLEYTKHLNKEHEI